MPRKERSYRLLIVDDNDADRRRYVRLLAHQAPGSCEITQAHDGVAGLAALRGSKFDCVLLDLNLPDTIGFGFLTAAAIEGELPCAVVLIAGNGNEAIAVEAMKRGVQDYIPKEKVNASSLWRAMTRAVIQTELRQRLARSLRELTEANAALKHEVAIRTATEIELLAAKDAAEQANRAKTRFVAMVTHELRTPLNGVLGYAQLLRIEGGLSTRQDARVGEMMRAGQHLLEMIERVLDLASIETGRLELHPVEISVRDLCEQCVAFIRPLAAERALSLGVISSSEAPRQIGIDAGWLRQVVINLLANAVKYTDAGSVELRLLVGAAPRGLRLEVADTGPGIAEADRPRLFQEFERLGATNSVEGAGLGLAIAARIVGLMHGSIGYVPNPGGGSVFWLELPTVDVAARSPADAPSTRVPSCRQRVLLVDDIAMNRDVISAFLRAAGHVVVSAESGLEAERLAAEQTFDLILMDMRMPGMDGLEATRRIRMLPGRHGRMPILALTAYSFPEQIEQCKEAGMDGHVSKPVQYETLVKAIDDVVAHAPLTLAEDGQSPLVTAVRAEREVEEQLPPRFDRAVFDRTVAFLSADDANAHLQSLRQREEQLLRLLDQRAVPAMLAEVADATSSMAGIFGFVALSEVSRTFERAMIHPAPQGDLIKQRLREETCVALAALDELMREKWMQPA